MYELKTKENDQSVESFINKIEDGQKRKDCLEVMSMMQKITRKKPKMWGGSIVGFGSYHYKYKSGHEGDFMITGFSPRKQNLTIYIMLGFPKYQELMDKLGKYKIGKSCLYIKKLDDVDRNILKDLIKRDVENMKKNYECK